MPFGASWYDRHVLPYLLDIACGLPPITRQRRKVISQAAGRVLEIGIGTGLNLAFYDPGKVELLVGIDPATEMHMLARRRSRRLGLPLELLQISAEEVPVQSGSFDTVICTYTLCSVSSPEQALREMRRVLRPGGKLLFAEHGLAPDEPVAKWQARLEPYWSKIAGGCHLTRDVPQLLAEAGFSADMESGYVAWTRCLAYNFVGIATVAT